MKRKIYSVLTALIFTLSVSTFAQPPSPNGGSAPNSGNTPVGGGAPIGSGLLIMAVLGAAFAGKKVYDFKNNQK